MMNPCKTCNGTGVVKTRDLVLLKEVCLSCKECDGTGESKERIIHYIEHIQNIMPESCW